MAGNINIRKKQKNEWGPEFVISQSSFEDLTGQTLSLPENGFGYFEDSDNATFQTFSNEQGNFYNPSVHKEFHLTKTSLISEEKYRQQFHPDQLFFDFE